MTRHTNRDRVWDLALRYALVEESFNVDQLQAQVAGEVNAGTIRDTLTTMVDQGWLSKATPHQWEPGPHIDHIGDVETDFEGIPDASTTNDREEYTDVEEIRDHRLDRISNSSNLVVETANSHILGTHGPLEESVKIPYSDGTPISVSLPRLYRHACALVCRDHDLVYDGDEIKAVLAPMLKQGDIVPVTTPLTMDTEEGTREISATDIDSVPLPLFTNVDELQLTSNDRFHTKTRHAIKIQSINDRIARGTYVNRSHLSSPKSTSSSSSNANLASKNPLREIAKKAGTTTDSQTGQSTKSFSDAWDERRKEILTEITSSHE